MSGTFFGKNVLCIQSTFTLVTGHFDVNEILKRVYPLSSSFMD